jgi:hypothetical protein
MSLELYIMPLIDIGVVVAGGIAYKRSAWFRANTSLFAGLLLVCNSIGRYFYMHFVFFGVPQFTTKTPKGISEIGYALSSIALVGIGVYVIHRALRTRSKSS